MGTTNTLAGGTLVVDIGGTGIKLIVLDAAGAPCCERRRALTPEPASPEAVLHTIEALRAGAPAHARTSVGFPGVVRRGVVENAPNLGTALWAGFPLAEALASRTGLPTRVLNDADLQGYGVIEGRGVELVLTLGTGLGTALFTDGRLVPNLELGHERYDRRRTYEDLVCDAELQRLGAKRWRKRVLAVLGRLDPILNPDRVHLGGGNARKLRRAVLPDKVRLFDNVEGMTGGARLWAEEVPARGTPPG